MVGRNGCVLYCACPGWSASRYVDVSHASPAGSPSLKSLRGCRLRQAAQRERELRDQLQGNSAGAG